MRTEKLIIRETHCIVSHFREIRVQSVGFNNLQRSATIDPPACSTISNGLQR